MLYPVGSDRLYRLPTCRPVARLSVLLRVGEFCRVCAPGLFKSPTVRSLHARRSAPSTAGSIVAVRMIRDLVGVSMAQSPRSTVNQKLRLGGKGATSIFRKIA